MADWKIGPTFPSELRAAGLSLDGYGWNIYSGEFSFAADVSESTVDAVNAVYAAHDPAAQTEPPTPYPPGVPAQQPAKQPLPGPK